MFFELHVEHIVIEMVIKQDLVEWQVRVGNGKILPPSSKLDQTIFFPSGFVLLEKISKHQ
jgi:acetyl/propionyl-CoA carboxylase alpha subunit